MLSELFPGKREVERETCWVEVAACVAILNVRLARFY